MSEERIFFTRQEQWDNGSVTSKEWCQYDRGRRVDLLNPKRTLYFNRQNEFEDWASSHGIMEILRQDYSRDVLDEEYEEIIGVLLVIYAAELAFVGYTYWYDEPEP